MSSFLFYIFQVSLLFSGLYLVYAILFSRFTFHAFNRSFLLLLIPLSLLLPFSSILFPKVNFFAVNIPLINDFSAFTNVDYLFTDDINSSTHRTIDWSFWVLTVYAVGVFIYLIRFLRTSYRLFKLKNNAKKEITNGTTVYSANVSNVFSYFRWIFVPQSQKEPCHEFIITHEKAHIQQWHSIDVLIAELFIAFCWFHPLAYVYRKSLKSVHEFQADAFVLKQHVKKSDYLTLLLQHLEPIKTNPVYNYFSHPTLKKRIEMITKSKSKNYYKYSYLLLIPIIAFTAMAFRGTTPIPPADFEQSLVYSKMQGNPSIAPIHKKDRKRFSSLFGAKRKHPQLKHAHTHGGIDIVANVGIPVIATADGIVAKANTEGNWGNLIVLSHAENFETWYAHLQGFAIQKHAIVKKGDTIGFVGTTGLSTGPHLHYEVHQNGKRLNPMNYMNN